MSVKITLCVATYRRPDRLASMLQSLRNQTFKDFEIVVSDNDPDASGAPAAQEAIQSGLLVNYAANDVNVGMVKNFNRSLQRATGEFVIFITDDDPLLDHALETLVSLADSHPGYACYFGGAGTFIESPESAAENGKTVGFHPELGKCSAGAIRIFSPEEAFEAVLLHKIFPHLLWSAGMVRRSVALQSGGLPDYGSPHMSDHFYLALAGLTGGMVVINKVVASRIIHTSNYSKSGGEILADVAVHGRAFMMQKIGASGPVETRTAMVDHYISDWAFGYMLWLHHIGRHDLQIAARQGAQLKALLRLPAFRKRLPRYLIRAYLPAVGRTLQRVRKLLGSA